MFLEQHFLLYCCFLSIRVLFESVWEWIKFSLLLFIQKLIDLSDLLFEFDLCVWLEESGCIVEQFDLLLVDFHLSIATLEQHKFTRHVWLGYTPIGEEALVKLVPLAVELTRGVFVHLILEVACNPGVVTLCITRVLHWSCRFEGIWHSFKFILI